MVNTYQSTALDRVVYGRGAIARIGDELARLGKHRALLLTGKSLRQGTPVVGDIEAALGERLVGIYDGVQPHVPSRTLDEAAALAVQVGADALISIGGGSPIDTAKLVALSLLDDRPQQEMPQIAIPTTLSAGEFTPIAGSTDEARRVKMIHADPRIVPRVVILDPEVSVHTPRVLWASSGIKALDHAIEVILARSPQPVTDVLAAEAIRRLRRALPRSVNEPFDIDVRAECQIGAWLSIMGAPSTGFRLSHLIGHQIGARWNIPHGITSCITLPHCLRFLAPQTTHRQTIIAEALDIPIAGRDPVDLADETAAAVARFIGSLGLPHRLRDAGAIEDELEDVAHEVVEETKLWQTDALTEPMVYDLLRRMW